MKLNFSLILFWHPHFYRESQCKPELIRLERLLLIFSWFKLFSPISFGFNHHNHHTGISSHEPPALQNISATYLKYTVTEEQCDAIFSYFALYHYIPSMITKHQINSEIIKKKMYHTLCTFNSWWWGSLFGLVHLLNLFLNLFIKDLIPLFLPPFYSFHSAPHRKNLPNSKHSCSADVLQISIRIDYPYYMVN